MQVLSEDETGQTNPAASELVDDVDAPFAEAQEQGIEIVHPLNREEWEVRRFFVRAPDGDEQRDSGDDGLDDVFGTCLQDGADDLDEEESEDSDEEEESRSRAKNHVQGLLLQGDQMALGSSRSTKRACSRNVNRHESLNTR
ncbi:VOC family protein [Brevibacterium linens]|uniref:VOC family protein n=1 Tax=Brevibacterium linens TaxID=1703 RepID=UPI003F89F8FE